ncbi:MULTISPECIES: ATP-dependent Clp protease ATP-binding subunit [Saccharopolyspora]|uniref:ATP-dependent Clp protease ATP-binding subunit n=1 Tax=Saccharopolyspora gregorii TaxID=33914 RepID=A0ABP6RS70_9PSEU|nr:MULTISPECIES: ATP-dependent Clp protease ATP-binding subunit [Saccharopolyspora]MCA1190469.1 ATP-dependent Clp protease ATP-binding subunit [Saccharopolyspora sp. 6T]MCA1196311.1 ATP-dependent Clp protease ATP-binding subunit [Saccharopolyspora sp. 6V]MCA1229973.1 ATP-dependent Clp protease ATP-binding subunit [Saccharopolyspora sp. 6M]MCA1283663.1 ATP-dependent Clp protease ATP-binding subunit [Saccharopolyspora sp. 7B]
MTGFFGSGGFGSSPFDDFLARYLSGGDGPNQPQRVDLTRLMSRHAQDLVANAARLTVEHGGRDLDTHHLLWAATRSETTRAMLERAGADPDPLAQRIEQQLPTGDAVEQPPALTPAAKRTLLESHQIARAVGASYIGPDHLLLALAANPESQAGRILAAAHVTLESLQAGPADPAQPRPDTAETSSTPTLEQFGQDLTTKARDGGLDPVIGRDEEIEQTIEVLSRRTKNNPVLIGEAGVGKTSVVEGLAQRVVDGQVPDVLQDKRVVQLDLSGVVAGTRYRGDFEERMNKLLDEISKNRDRLIIFIDELHTVVGAGGSDGAVDAGNMLKPKLARGELHVVGATTLDEYRTNIEKDAALERRFQPITVDEPSVADTERILCGLRDRYEAHHQVRFHDDAIRAAAELADRYITDRFLPDKAIDLIDQAGARKRLRTGTPDTDLRELEQRNDELSRDKAQAIAEEDYERAANLRDEIVAVRERIRSQRQGGGGIPVVGREEIADVVSRATGIPATQLTEQEKTRLLNLEEQLHKRVVGQDEAVHAIARAVRRSRTGMGDPNRPVGTFLFLGPTGVGKTELARALAESLFGDQDRMVRLDMSEFQEAHTASRMVGSPPGYVGYGEAGQLTEAVRRRPYSVILLDEIEKAHPDVFNTLLQVLDDGRLTDGQGRTVDFSNTVLIMTSNLGSDIISQRSGVLGFSSRGQEQADEPARDRLMARLRDAFRPEFLNRIDEVVMFRRLETDQLHRITELLLGDTRERLGTQDIEVDFSNAAVDWITEHGHQPDYGARPLRRTIQREVDDSISELLLEGKLGEGQRVEVDTSGDQLTFQIRPALETGAGTS